MHVNHILRLDPWSAREKITKFPFGFINFALEGEKALLKNNKFKLQIQLYDKNMPEQVGQTNQGVT